MNKTGISTRFSGMLGKKKFKVGEMMPCGPMRDTASRRSNEIDRILEKDRRKENKAIKLLLLGPGEAGKSTLTKQMKIIHGDHLTLEEKMSNIPHIKQNIYDSMLAILAFMKEREIPLSNRHDLQPYADLILDNWILSTNQLGTDGLKIVHDKTFLSSPEFFTAVDLLWKDEGLQEAFGRSAEYQLLDCSKYFFNRIDDIRCPDYVPSQQDVIRCRIMTTSIQEIKYEVKVDRDLVHFKILDVGGQRGERRKWITLFENVTAVLYVADVSSFDQTLREDSTSSRMLEGLKVFYQAWNTKFLRSVSILIFLNKVDILREKIEQGKSFGDSLLKIIQEAEDKINDPETSPYDKKVYSVIRDILKNNPYDSFTFTEEDRKGFMHQYPFPQESVQQSTGKKLFATKKGSNASQIEISDEVIKAASYMRMLFKKIIWSTDRCIHKDRTFEFYYTCAVDNVSVEKVLKGCRNIIIRQHLKRFGIDVVS